jgi:hypothetical protein
MATDLLEPHTSPAAAPSESTGDLSWAWLTGTAVVVLAALHLPSVVRTPLDADALHYDLCAWTIAHGGVMYRDALDTNPPGMQWIHLLLRSVAGWSSETLQIADILVAAVNIVLLVRLLPERASWGVRWTMVLVLGSCFLSESEWCRVQRDSWMLVPSLLALHCRRRQLRVWREGGNLWLLTFAEGMCWAVGFWIKPFVAIPALLCWIVSARMGQASGTTLARLGGDFCLLMLGGMAVGALGIAWLVGAGAWQWFAELMFDWNRQYALHRAMSRYFEEYLLSVPLRLFPWMFIHLFAIPFALLDLARLRWRRRATTADGDGVLLSAFYLAWLAQAVFLQQPFDYVHMPAILLGLAVSCRRFAAAAPGTGRTMLMALLLLFVCLRLPTLTQARAQTWTACFATPTPELRDRLLFLPRTSLVDQVGVEEFLRSQGVKDGEVGCWTPQAAPVLLDLGVRPATRYLLFHINLRVFKRQRDRIYADAAASQQRYLIVDHSMTEWWCVTDLHARAFIRPPRESVYPHDRLVYTSGRYAVYAVDGPSMRKWVEDNIDIDQ